jgi:hypothetical protein
MCWTLLGEYYRRGAGLLACAFSIGVVPSAIPIHVHATEPPRADEAKWFLTLLSHRVVGGRRVEVGSVQAALAGVADLRS